MNNLNYLYLFSNLKKQKKINKNFSKKIISNLTYIFNIFNLLLN